MRCRAERLDGMAHMLAGLGRPFTVVKPAELRTAVAGLRRPAGRVRRPLDQRDSSASMRRISGAKRLADCGPQGVRTAR